MTIDKPRSLIADVVSTLQTWWRQDRVRSSPREGKLLRLAPGAVLCIGGQTLEVEQRDLISTETCQRLRLGCRGVEGSSELWIHLDSDIAIAWIFDGQETTLAPDDIEIWSEK